MDDRAIEHAVREELEWAPHVDATNISVDVRDGVVRLGGFVASLAEKRAAERVTWHVRGVLGLAQDIEVRLTSGQRHDDVEIARRAVAVLQWDTLIPDERIRVRVEAGVVTLSGVLDWNYQRQEAEARIQQLAGVLAVDNQLLVHPAVAAQDIVAKVRRAFARHANLDARRIAVSVEDVPGSAPGDAGGGAQITLSGSVRTLAARRIAENAAWSAAGVAAVENQLQVLR